MQESATSGSEVINSLGNKRKKFKMRTQSKKILIKGQSMFSEPILAMQNEEDTDEEEDQLQRDSEADVNQQTEPPVMASSRWGAPQIGGSRW
jgi:hypothetical protein